MSHPARLIPTALLTLLATGAAAVDAVSDKLVPAEGAWWGMYLRAYSDWNWSKPFTDLEARIDRRIDIVHRYHDMSDQGGNGRFPDVDERLLAEGGRILFCAWESRTFAGGVNYTWPQIARGELDAVIDAQAARIKALPYQVFIDFDHEPEGSWHDVDGKGPDFVAAYRRIVDRFRAADATNAVWVWTVMGWSGAYDRYQSFYPGDGYVDWIGYDPYNWYGHGHSPEWRSFEQIATPFYDWLHANSGPGHQFASKPFMLSEFGCADDPARKGDWFRAIPGVLTTRLPNIRALVYFNVDKEADWRVDSSPEALAGYIEAGRHPYLNQRGAADQAPTVAQAASASPSPATGTTTTLSVLGTDDGGEGALTYTWATSGTVPATVRFSRNASNAAKSTVATFAKAGTYAFTVTIRDAGGRTTTSPVTVTVRQSVTAVRVAP